MNVSEDEHFKYATKKSTTSYNKEIDKYGSDEMFILKLTVILKSETP